MSPAIALVVTDAEAGVALSARARWNAEILYECKIFQISRVKSVKSLYFDTILCYHFLMKRKHQSTLELIFARPVSANVRWADIEAIFQELGAELDEREDSRVEVFLFGLVRVFHRPHPSPDTDKGAVAAIRKWLEENGVKP
ncbi:MAG: type II toxin-antitoxin system HicA family toxin [Sulfuricella sp.]